MIGPENGACRDVQGFSHYHRYTRARNGDKQIKGDNPCKPAARYFPANQLRTF